MISKKTALKALADYHRVKPQEKLLAADTSGGVFWCEVTDGVPVLQCRHGDYEFTGSFNKSVFKGEVSAFVTADSSDLSGWTLHGSELFDGASWLERDALELGGQDFTIDGTAFESAEDMIVRRKIFELYTSADLNLSLYSSGAGKNLDLLVNCGGEFDNYGNPAILEREFNFTLVWRQDEKLLRLYIDSEKIYEVEVPGFAQRRRFEQVRLGAGILHENSFWKGRLGVFKVYDGLALLNEKTMSAGVATNEQVNAMLSDIFS